ncbi:ATP-binding protein [Vibrio hepatarius]|uniref:ATP-binding protein n=1 Tax=Vibrio hepatarius TaxID=171383 RepID=UPI00142D5D4B|nr:ATP-binding protein [Vibrio hepatarius]NIY84274.1 HAMP domain-containing protein [Vibrio hepatarius]
MKKWSTIGAKLILAFTGTTALLTVVSAVAWLTWSRLDGQVSELLENSVPKYNTSYLLESRSSEIRHRVQLLPTLTNRVEIDSLVVELSEQLAAVKAALTDVQTNPLDDEEAAILSELYLELEQTLSNYSHLVQQRVEQTRQINKLKEQISWLHQDIRSELTPIRQELHWLISRGEDGEERTIALEQLRTIQHVLDVESDVFSMTSDVMEAEQLAQVHNAIKVIQYKLDELIKSSQPILSLRSSISYQQLIQELEVLLLPQGVFYLQALDKVALNHRIASLQEQIDTQLGEIHKQIAQVVKRADKTFVDVKKQTATLVSYGNHILIVCFSVSILMSLFLTYYFINRRIVARLTAISNSIDAITKGDLSHPILVDGDDEIGRLSEKLIEYGESVKEMQRTNAVSLINNTSASLLTCDLAGYVESANLSARRLLTMQGEIEQKLIWQSFEGDNQLILARVFKRGGTLFKEGRDEITLCVVGLTHCYLHFDFHLFSHGQLNKVIVTITDITEQALTAKELERRVAEKTRDLVEKNEMLCEEINERERTEMHLKKTQGELIQAAKMAVVGQTMTSLAHELNQPLNAMSTYLYSAKLSCESGNVAAVNKSIDQVESLSHRMSKIISSLRSFAKKPDAEQPARQLILKDVVEQAITIVNTKAKRQMIEIDNQIDDNMDVFGNELAIEQVLINLLVNSCDAISELNASERKITILPLYSSDTHHVVAIEDSGTGFDTHIVEKLFTPFTTTKEVGLGLGLTISQSLMEKYAGHIYLASSLEKGALVILELPYAKS